jgi:aspartyl-tRNA(Asn)/glutamyl-tRNA(Gln) amidotransferase subunit A
MAGFDERLDQRRTTRCPTTLRGLNVDLSSSGRGRAAAFRRRPDADCDRCSSRSRGARDARGKGRRALVEVTCRTDLSVPTYYVVAPAEARLTCRASTACASATAATTRVDLLDLYCRLPRRGLRCRGQAPHPDRHLRAVGRLLRRLLPAGAKSPPADRGRLQAGVRRRRRHCRPDHAEPGLQARRQDRRPDRNVPERHLHDRCESRGPARPVGSLRFRLDGLPVGLHLVGPHFGEQVILNAAHSYQQDTDWHTRCPEDFR